MALTNRPRRQRDVRPVLNVLEERSLLNGAMPSLAHVAAAVKPLAAPATFTGLSDITIISAVNSKGYHFVNFDGPNAGTVAGSGTNMNGISNSGIAVGFTIANDLTTLTNFTAYHANPRLGRVLAPSPTGAMAFGINTAGVVVGTDGAGHAAFLYRNQLKTFIPFNGTSAVAFGINDRNMIVGQYTAGAISPGFVRFPNGTFLQIDAPPSAGMNVVNAQGINNNGEIVGFYVGADGQDHGFTANIRSAVGGFITVTPVADPLIPVVPGEPGATFVFSQILGVNDHGIAVGYYGDSTTSQHGFIYNTRTGQYAFLDDPSEAFSGGVVVTQITGITNAGEITGFYSDANGVFHGFAARRL